MSVIISGRNGRSKSAWQEPDEGPAARDAQTYQMEVSLREQQLLLRLRMLEAGSWGLEVVKEARGREGLVRFRVVEG